MSWKGSLPKWSYKGKSCGTAVLQFVQYGSDIVVQYLYVTARVTQIDCKKKFVKFQQTHWDMNLWKNYKKSRILHSVYPDRAIHDNTKSERWKLPPVVKFYSTRRRSIPDVNDDNKPGAELLGKRGQWPEIDGILVDLQNGPETRNIVLERCFSKKFAKGAIPEQNGRDVSSQRKWTRLIQGLWTRLIAFKTIETPSKL